MYLSKEEEKILDGEMGEAYRLAMEVVVKVGDVLNAEKLVKISSAHISGVSYKNIGDEGLDFLRKLKINGAKFTVKTTINPAGMDIIDWKKMNVEKFFAKKQLEIIRIFKEIGAIILLSCTPYYYLSINKGEHLAWAESNAVLYANSVIGALTNREGGPMAIFEAIVGKAPYTGLHIKDNRVPTLVIDLKFLKKILEKKKMYAMLGYYVGFIAKKGVPLIVNYPKELISSSSIRLFLAAIGASSGIGLVILENFSPDFYEMKNLDLNYIEKMTPEFEDIVGISDRIERSINGNVDAIVLGCPHLSMEDIKKLAAFFKYNIPRKRIILFTARKIDKIGREYINILKRRGIEVYYDTCMVVADLRKMNIHNIIVDSAKAAYYLSTQGYNVRLMTLEEVLEYAIKK